jgi:hypothetical protein
MLLISQGKKRAIKGRLQATCFFWCRGIVGSWLHRSAFLGSLDVLG